MKEKTVRKVRTVRADSPEEFDELYNRISEELGSRVTDVKEIDAGTVRFYYTETERVPEELKDAFEANGCEATCSDCPFLEVGDDARRKWWPCKYSTYGESSKTSRACETFYREAISMMREACRNE